MSVGIPIYQRILYDSPIIPGKDAKTGSSGQEQFLEKYNSLSVSQKSSRQIVPRAVSAPVVSLTKLRTNPCLQSERWLERKQYLDHTRATKKKSNIILHRQDKGYYIAGHKVPLVDRYDIDEEELIKLQMLAHSRMTKSTRPSSVNSSIFNQRGRLLSPELNGRNMSPVSSTSMVEADKRKNILERRSQIVDDREKRKELRREHKREKAKRLDEKMKFETEMAEKYKPQKPEKKSLIFLTEQSNEEKEESKRIFLTETDFTIGGDEEKVSTYSFINEKQRHAFSCIFNEMDKNQDGMIDINEIKQNLFPFTSKDNLKHFLEVFDLNKDHMVEMREFVTICALNDKLCGTRTESGNTSLTLDLERLAQHITIYKELFAVIDDDCDGRIQIDEIMLMITTAVAGDESVDEEEGRRVLRDMEKDDAGHIDFASFLCYIPFFAKLLHVILDSPLSIENLEQARDCVLRKNSKKPGDQK